MSKYKQLKAPKKKINKDTDNYNVKTVIPVVVGAIAGNLIFPGVGGVVMGSLIGGLTGISTNNKDKKMAKVPVFYSFHFGSDVMRVQQIRNIGSIEGNAPTTPNEWETLKRTGKKAVENWIDKKGSLGVGPSQPLDFI